MGDLALIEILLIFFHLNCGSLTCFRGLGVKLGMPENLILRRKAGRPKGAASTTQIKMLELLRVLSPDAMVTVGKKFAASLGIKKTEGE